MSTLVSKFFSAFETNNKCMLFDLSNQKGFSGHQLLDLIDQTASFLEQLGIQTGQRFICIADNNIETALILLTSMRHGFCVAILPPNIENKSLLHQAKKIDVDVYIDTTSAYVLNDRESKKINFNTTDLSSLSRTEPKTVTAKQPFIITFTSGTTGDQKAIIHSADTFIRCANAFNYISGITADDRFLNFMPMHYMAGIFNGIIAPLAAEALVIIDKTFSIETALKFASIIREEQITCVWMAPTMLSLFVKMDRTEHVLGESLRKIFIGTGALSLSEGEDFYHRYGIPPLQSYGLSELLYVSVDHGEDYQFGSCGMPLPGVKIRNNASGIAEIKSPYQCLGWIENNEYQPAQTIFKTNDLIDLDPNGRVNILGRSDDTIIRGGLNISPLEIEAFLKPIVGDPEFYIASVQDNTLGESLVLVINSAIPEQHNLKASCNSRLKSKGKITIDHVVFVEDFPKTVMGKLKRKELKKVISRRLGR